MTPPLLPNSPLMMSCWARAADPPTSRARNTAIPIRGRAGKRMGHLLMKSPAGGRTSGRRLCTPCLLGGGGARREVLEELLHRLVDRLGVLAVGLDLILGQPAPDHLLRVRIDEVHDQGSHGDVRLCRLSHAAAHAAPAAVTEASHARRRPLLLL